MEDRPAQMAHCAPDLRFHALVAPLIPSNPATGSGGISIDCEAREGLLAFLQKRPPRWAIG